ncbi:MAG: Smr/MutS family protein [Desulfobacteraceae bacterium]|jgi:DNA-nicking Smr family endonuclease
MKKRKKPYPFNPVFKDVEVQIEARPEESRPDSSPAPPVDPVSEDTRSFLEAMADVEPLDHRKQKMPPHPRGRTYPAHPAPNETQEALEHLNGLVHGSVDMDISFTDEYMEGARKGVSRKTVKRLKRGRFPVQDHIDLHGLTRHEAEKRVREFLLQSHKMGLRCVLIVHGRGLNSPSSFPVLKERLPVWFSRGPVRKIVLAFATARPYDGGGGAVYVLLQKR